MPRKARIDAPIKVPKKYNVSIGELRSGGRRRAVVQDRRAMLWIGVRELGYSGAEVMVEIDGMRGVRTGVRGWMDDDGFLYIANALVYGDGREYNIGLIVLNYDMLEDVANTLDLSLPVKEIVKNEQITGWAVKEIQAHLKKTFGGYEVPKIFAIIEEDFILENGLLTQTMKVKRSEVVKKYKDIIEGLY